MLGSLNNLQIDTLLRSELIGRIGCSIDGNTYIVPVAYVYDGEFIYSYTQEGKKTTMLRANPSVCFQVDHITDMANWQSVVVQGKFQELEGEEKESALQLLTTRLMPIKTGESNQPKYGMEKIHSHVKPFTKFITYRIQILEQSGRFEKE
ncbi:pyridoxamine 5'-phosphate oxidase family protein [Roseivirga echinicomitans]|uniref:Pyridoxamine 5'-phosphate oxidase n=1 Tax=Roseivirga echinicomitans TaxID=296218 RepID=A0A150XUT9_9BACT|nr:pyridoxamine 5'-phosphate oxidase family protein [Roseivirga echinicomitans]KYG82483.1 hypothetical protein AWN68_14610 [Roseivirga echinicomitans]